MGAVSFHLCNDKCRINSVKFVEMSILFMGNIHSSCTILMINFKHINMFLLKEEQQLQFISTHVGIFVR